MTFFSTDSIIETIHMIKLNNLDIRTVTMSLSLRDCIDTDVKIVGDKIYDKITKYAKNLSLYADEIENEKSVAGIAGFWDHRSLGVEHFRDVRLCPDGVGIGEYVARGRGEPDAA